MGGGRDAKKKAAKKRGEVVGGKGAVKTEKRTEQNEQKKARRVDKQLEGNEDDIDMLLAKWVHARRKTGSAPPLVE